MGTAWCPGAALTLPPLGFDLPSVTAWILGLLSLGFAPWAAWCAGTDPGGDRRRACGSRRRAGASPGTRSPGSGLLLHPARRRPRLDGAQSGEPRRDRGLEAGRFDELVGRMAGRAVLPDLTTRANLEALGMTAGEGGMGGPA